MSEALLAPAGCRAGIWGTIRKHFAVRSRARSRRRVWRATRHRTSRPRGEEWRAPPDHRAGAHHGFDRGAHARAHPRATSERVGARFIARPARSVAARVKRGTWNVPDDEVPSDERVGGGGDAVALDLDAEEPEPDPIPPALGSFVPGRDDGMARMPVPDIALESPGRWSPISFAFLGDAVWELYVRRAPSSPPARPLDYDLKCKRAVRRRHRTSSSDISSNEASSQVRAHPNPNPNCNPDQPRNRCASLTRVRPRSAEKETGVVRWGRNASYGNVPTRLRGKEKVATRYTVTRGARVRGWVVVHDGPGTTRGDDGGVGEGRGAGASRRDGGWEGEREGEIEHRGVLVRGDGRSGRATDEIMIFYPRFRTRSSSARRMLAAPLLDFERLTPASPSPSPPRTTVPIPASTGFVPVLCY